MSVVRDDTTGLEKVVLEHQGSSAEVYLHGAHVTSFKPNGKEVIFVSRDAVYQPPKAIRGGVPVCWPQFNDMGPIHSHGFARNSMFNVSSISPSSATLSLCSDEDTIKIWPHAFELLVTVTITDDGALVQTVEAKNTGTESFSTTCALHTYFAVSAIGDIVVTGLEGCSYHDSLNDRALATGDEAPIGITSEADRIYVNTGEEICIRDAGYKHCVKLQKSNLSDAVLWNPWIEKSKGFKDFADDEYLSMVCIEPSNAAMYLRGSTADVAPGSSWTGSQTISVVPMDA